MCVFILFFLHADIQINWQVSSVRSEWISWPYHSTFIASGWMWLDVLIDVGMLVYVDLKLSHDDWKHMNTYCIFKNGAWSAHHSHLFLFQQHPVRSLLSSVKPVTAPADLRWWLVGHDGTCFFMKMLKVKVFEGYWTLSEDEAGRCK